MVILLCRKPVVASPSADCGVSFWTADEQTWVYLLGLLAVQVLGREIFKRWGPFKDDAALFAHQVQHVQLLCTSTRMISSWLRVVQVLCWGKGGGVC